MNTKILFFINFTITKGIGDTYRKTILPNSKWDIMILWAYSYDVFKKTKARVGVRILIRIQWTKRDKNARQKCMKKCMTKMHVVYLLIIFKSTRIPIVVIIT